MKNLFLALGLLFLVDFTQASTVTKEVVCESPEGDRITLATFTKNGMGAYVEAKWIKDLYREYRTDVVALKSILMDENEEFFQTKISQTQTVFYMITVPNVGGIWILTVDFEKDGSITAEIKIDDRGPVKAKFQCKDTVLTQEAETEEAHQ